MNDNVFNLDSKKSDWEKIGNFEVNEVENLKKKKGGDNYDFNNNKIIIKESGASSEINSISITDYCPEGKQSQDDEGNFNEKIFDILKEVDNLNELKDIFSEYLDDENNYIVSVYAVDYILDKVREKKISNIALDDYEIVSENYDFDQKHIKDKDNWNNLHNEKLSLIKNNNELEKSFLKFRRKKEILRNKKKIKEIERLEEEIDLYWDEKLIEVKTKGDLLLWVDNYYWYSDDVKKTYKKRLRDKKWWEGIYKNSRYDEIKGFHKIAMSVMPQKIIQKIEIDFGLFFEINE